MNLKKMLPCLGLVMLVLVSRPANAQTVPGPLPQTILITGSRIFVMGNIQGQMVYTTSIPLGPSIPPPPGAPAPPILAEPASFTVNQAMMSGNGPILANGPALPAGADNVPFYEIEFASGNDLTMTACLLKMKHTQQYNFTRISGVGIVTWVPALNYPDPKGMMEKIYFLSLADCI